MAHYLFVDLETTGFIKAPKGGIDLNKDGQFPHIVQMSWQLHACDASTKTFTVRSDQDFIIRPTADYTIPAESTKIHGISQEHALAHGVPLKTALKAFINDMFLYVPRREDGYVNIPQITIVCHNVEFDVPILMHNLFKAKDEDEFFLKFCFQGQFINYLGFGKKIQCICTMLDTIDLCKLPYANGGRGYKYPKLNELFYTLFQEAPKGQLHNSKFDVECTIACFKELYARGNLLTIRNMNLGSIENGFDFKLLE